jgi:hypothetical protein
VLNGAMLRHTFVFSHVHGKKRSNTRDIVFEDIVRVTQTGKYKRPARWENENWKYEIQGLDLQGEETTAIIAVDNEGCWVTIVTCF